MKRLLCVLLTLALALAQISVLAEGAQPVKLTETATPQPTSEDLTIQPLGEATPTPDPDATPEPTPTPKPVVIRGDAAENEFVVGSTTQMSGNFFNEMWGNNTADMDVRALLHGYSTVAWTKGGEEDGGNYAVDPIVVLETTTALNARGDKTYTFTLNDKLTYNDETPVTARDYVFSVLLQSCAEAGALGAMTESYSHLYGYQDYVDGVTNYIMGLRLLGEYSFSMTVPAEMFPYFYELMYVNVTPVPMSVIAPGCDIADDGQGAYIVNPTEEEMKEDPTLEPFTSELLQRTLLDPETGYMTRPQVVCGPYQLLEYDAENHIAHFERNPLYAGNFEGQIPEIEYLCFRQVDNETMIEEFQAGNVQLINKASSAEPINAALLLVGQGDAQSINYLRTGFSFLAFACESEPTSILEVRQAISCLVDADQLVAEYLSGYGLPTYGYYGYGLWEANQQRVVLDELLDHYAFDTGRAISLLESVGWLYNEAGERYTLGTDEIRYRMNAENELEPLVIRWAKTPGTTSEYVMTMLQANFLAAGIDLQITEMPFAEMLTHYYRQTDREYDMFFMASNFGHVYDPYYAVNGDAQWQGVHNTTGIDDQELARLADDLRRTESDDLEGFTQKFIAFQQRWNALVPMTPIYSNVYFDIYIPGLYSYDVNAQWGWAAAILYASYTEPVPENPTEVLLGEDTEGTILIP